MNSQRLCVSEGIAFFEGAVVPHAFSTCELGNVSPNYGPPEEASRVRREVLGFLKIPRLRVVRMIPEHSNRVWKVNGVEADSSVPCDALITRERGIALAMSPADCLPILFTNAYSTFVALAHAGRKGTEKQVTVSTVKALQGLGFSSREILVYIGPGICRDCYNDNLRAKNLAQLLTNGVPADNIFYAPECTACSQGSDSKPLFFSHRRAVTKKDREGRFEVVVCRS